MVNEPYPQQLARNLEVVDAHLRNEAHDVDAVMGLYTDDIVLEAPCRQVRYVGRESIRANYLRLFGSMSHVQITPIDRFATLDRVVDECLVQLRIAGNGIDNLSLPIGMDVALRLLHVFHLRDGRIAREIVYESWTPLA